MNTSTIVSLLTPVIVPLVITGVKKVVPLIPTWLLPTLCPLIGVVIDFITHLSTGSNMNFAVSAALGLAGVGLREIVDQLKQVQAASNT